MKKIQVMGHLDVVVATVIEVEDNEKLSPEEIFDRATEQFTGVHQLCGNGGCGEKLIGVDGQYDSIMADSDVTFDDFSEL